MNYFSSGSNQSQGNNIGRFDSMDTQDEIDIEGASENQGLINKTKSQAQEVSKTITDKLGSLSGDV